MKYSKEVFKKINIIIDWRYKTTTSPSVIPAKIVRIPCDEPNNYYYYIYHNCELFAGKSYQKLFNEYKYYIPINNFKETDPKKILSKVLIFFGHFLSSWWLYNSVSFQEQKTFEDIEL